MQDHHFGERDIAYRTNEFRASRQTLVFIHGLSGSTSAWELYERYFEDAYNILTYDIRGHGYSNRPREYQDYKLTEYTADLEALLEHLEIDSCILVSHSFGSLIAEQYLIEYPRRVRKAVLLSPCAAPYQNPIARLAYPFTWLATALLKVLPFSHHAGRRVDYSKYPDTTDWDIPIMWANIRANSLHVYIYCTLQTFHLDVRHHLKDISIPILLIHGNRDTIFPVRNAKYMHEHLSNSQLILLKDIDHILVLNRFPEVSKAIAEFVG